MGIYNTMTETSSNPLLPLKKRKRPFDDSIDNTLVVATKKAALLGNSKYKGIVEHHNGHWGAQIYIDHKRIWLGTFKSSVEAAMAYDSASIKLRSFDANSHRNFPWNAFTVHEPNFQKGYTTEAVLDMIKNGSYQNKFSDFLSHTSQNVASNNILGSKQVHNSDKSLKCTELFRKALTPSDVGKLNRLVIPKKNAFKYLPLINDDINEREEGEIVEDVEVVFYDRTIRQWKFRYCYWRSSQSFVFTSGWKRFVKEKSLKERDVIVFYTCGLEGRSKNFLMIDVHYYSEDDSVVIDEEVNDTVHYSSEGEVITENFVNFKVKEEETKSVENKGGFMLFGVKIQ